MTFLCFLGTLPPSLVVLFMGPMVLFKVYVTALNIHKHHDRLLFTVIQFIIETTAHKEMISITQPFKQLFATLELTTITTGGDYKIITVTHYVL